MESKPTTAEAMIKLADSIDSLASAWENDAKLTSKTASVRYTDFGTLDQTTPSGDLDPLTKFCLGM